MGRWEQIESFFYETLERPESEREAFLRRACANDAELFKEVSGLIRSSGDVGAFGPWAAAAAVKLISPTPTLAPGERLGPYEILSFIAAGGMGAVYRAYDPRTGRQVAVKVCAERFSERFEREVRTIAALNHPNICTLFDVGPNYLVMELVEGESPKGPIPLETALNYALQIADALEAAHEKGIAHRDLKPANIKIKADGILKVLDFGLAKVLPTAAVSTAEPGNSPTFSIAATEAGLIVGTAGYMSPEQARSKPVDKRTDVWAFGVVLYEMLTGEKMFEGETVSDTLAQILTKEPDLSRVPQKLRKLLSRCLQKDPTKRLRDIGDVQFLLDEDAPHEIPKSKKTLSAKLSLLLAAAAIISAVVVGFTSYRRFFTTDTARPNALRLSLLLPERATLNDGSVPALSPDGRWLAIAAIVNGQQALWVRELNGLGARLLAGTDGATYPFWSHDSQWIGFFTVAGKLKKIKVVRGPAITICDAPAGRGGTWNQNNVIVYAINTLGGGLFRVSAAGGTPVQISHANIDPGEAGHRGPWFLPDGRHFIYTARAVDSEGARVYVADVESTDPKKERRAVLSADSNAIYVPPGYLLFVRDRTLMAQAFHATRFQTIGDAIPLADGVDYHGTSTYAFSASDTGVIAYLSGARNAQMSWFDRAGQPLGTVGPAGEMRWSAISPDGKTIAYDRLDAQTSFYDVWLHDLTTHTDSRFTFGPFANQFPVWSPDGSHLAFRSTVPKNISIYQKAITGAGDKETLDNDGTSHPKHASDWSRDYLIEVRNASGIWLLPMRGEKKPFAYIDTEFTEIDPVLSPNGQWLAYSSDASKRSEIYIETFPTRSVKWQVSANGGSLPRWSRDSKELYFIAADRKLMAVGIEGGPKLVRGTPKPLFETHLPTNGRYDVTNDGRFLIPTQIESTGSVPMTMIVNWPADLKK
jgi:serine/threonine protein kinase/Tol biopolymer transport system component